MHATIRPATGPEVANRWCIRWPDRLIQPTAQMHVSSVTDPRSSDSRLVLGDTVVLEPGVWYVIEYHTDAVVAH